MTENEALSELEKFQLQVEHSIAEEECCEYENPEEDLQKDKKFIDAFKIATKALKEIQQYREIGTVEECREAVEKQKAKKRIYPKTALERYYHAPECPNCKRELKPQICGYTLSQAIGIYSHCPWCGQAIDENLEV